jgi:hypothetical protein
VEIPLSNLAFKINLRRYTEVPNRVVPPRQDITMFFSEFCREVVG